MSMMKLLRAALVAVLAFAPLAVEAGPFANRHIRVANDVSAPILPSLDLQFTNGEALDALVTYTRASPAFCYDSAGVLQSFANGVARVNCYVYDGANWVIRGFWIEELRKNELLQSEDQDTTWNKLSGLEVTVNTDVAPDGNTTADTITDDSGNSEGINQTWIALIANSETWVISFFAKKDAIAATTRFGQLQMYFEGGTTTSVFLGYDSSTGNIDAALTGTGVLAGSGVIDVGDYWRFWIALTNNATGNANVRFENYPAAGANADLTTQSSAATGSQVVWGYQLEEGTLPTSYMGKTLAGTITRAADIATVEGGNFSGFWNDGGTGTLAIEATRAVGQAEAVAILSIQNGVSADDRILFILDGATGQRLRFSYRNGGVFQADILGDLTWTDNVPVKMIASWGTNDSSFFADGAQIGTIDTSVILVSGQDNMKIGANQGGGQIWGGHIARVRVWLPNLDLGYLAARSQ